MDTHLLLAVFHIFLVVPFFLYVGLQRAATPEGVYTACLTLGVVITLYHGYKAYARWQSSSPYIWVNLIHMLAVGPLLIYIGTKGKDTERAAYEMLLLLGFGAGGYHIYNLIQNLNNIHSD
jgi:hypothetical protein